MSRGPAGVSFHNLMAVFPSSPETVCRQAKGFSPATNGLQPTSYDNLPSPAPVDQNSRCAPISLRPTRLTYPHR